MIDEVDADFNEVVLLPNTLKSAKTLSRYSNELARHSVPAIGSAVQRNVVHQVVDKIDTEFLTGAATADGNGNHGPKGLLNISGIQTADALDATDGLTLIDSAIAAIAKFYTAEIKRPEGSLLPVHR